MARGKHKGKKKAEESAATPDAEPADTPLERPEAKQSQPPTPTKVARKKPGLVGSCLEYYREFPVMLLPLLLNLLAIAWVIHNHYRSWATVEALVSSRTVTKYVSQDEDSYHEYFPAAISYSYTYAGREFTGEFEDDKIDDGSWGTNSYADAVVEAKRWKIGDPIQILVDPSNPEISAREKPRLFLPLLGLLVVCGALLLATIDGAGASMELGCAIAIFTSPALYMTYQSRIPDAEEIDARFSVLPYVSVMKDYPSLGYVPQNKLHKFDSFEQLLQEWGRPDDLWIETQDGGRRLTLTYRHLADWSEAWSVDFQLPQGEGPPLPIGAPRKDNPSR